MPQAPYFAVHFLLGIFLVEFIKVKTDIVRIYQQYDLCELFETKYENIYETTNYFGTVEGEFKTRCNNHKKLFTPY